MDIQSLVIILRGALSPNSDERKAAEESLNQFQYTPQHLVRLLQIIVDGSSDMAVREVASIHFKNFIMKNWSPHDTGEQSKILPGDKEMVRQNVLISVAQVPSLLRVQLGESLKTMICADYPEQWPTLLRWVKHNLLDQQVYGILFVLRILSRKYARVCDTNEFTFFTISVIFLFASVKAINANCTFLLIQNPVKSVLQEMVFMFLNLSSFVFSSFHGIMFVYVHMYVTISCI